MTVHSGQTRLHVFRDYTFEIPDVKVLEKPFNDLINSGNERIVLEKFPRFTEKNRRLSDPLYKLFGYPSKVYYQDIANFVEAFTKPGDLVLDPMAGTGSTAIAALNAGRKAIISDASPAASFVAKGFLLPIEREPLLDTYYTVLNTITRPIHDLYSVPCRCPSGCTANGFIENFYVSDWYKCPSCSHHYPLLGNYVGKRSVYQCPKCGQKINIGSPKDKRNRIRRRWPTILDIVCLGCKCGNKRHKRNVTADDLKVIHSNLEEFKKKYKNLWVPTAKIVTDRCYTRKGSWPGFEKGACVSDLFSPINLYALALLYQRILEIKHSSLKHLMLFTFLGSLIRSSNRMYTTSVVKTYYQVPPVGKVQNVLAVFERKFNNLIEAKAYQKLIMKQVNLERTVRVFSWDARELPLPDNSIDYVFLDPPYGGQVPYFELNLFYSSWLKEEERWNDEIIIPMETDEDPYYVDIWAKMITPAFREIYRVLKPGRFFTLMFHSKSSLIWNKLQEILFTTMTRNGGFIYKFIYSMERGTTFHINQKDSSNPKTAFITYQKPFSEADRNHIDNSKKIDWHKISTERIARLGNQVSLWEVQNEVIIYVHQSGIFEVPSSVEIIKGFKHEGWEYNPESDKMVKSR